MERGWVFALIVLCSMGALAQPQGASGWTKLIDEGKCKEAEKLCTASLNATSILEQTEAHKCLANVALCGHSIIQLEGDDVGGGNIHGGYEAAATDEALAHLDAALKFSPQDLSIHQGRLHLLEISTRYDQMLKAIEESCTIYKGSGAPQAWLAYVDELNESRQYRIALEFMKVLEKHYPDDPDVIANVGAFLMILRRDAEALPYLKRAVEMAPNDPINVWDLGRAYDYAGETKLADEWYQKALPLMKDPEELHHSTCIYAEFVATKLNQTARACEMQKKNCAEDQQTACKEKK